MGAWTFFEGQWMEGNPRLLGPLHQAMWLSSVVFDGARAFEDVAPDLDQHCARTIASALALGLKPPLSGEEVLGLAFDGIRRFPSGSQLYIRPMFWAEEGMAVAVPESTNFAISVYEEAMPEDKGFSACLSDVRRPLPETAPTDAKAGCLYPAIGRALRKARGNGFNNAVVLDPLGHVAEFATANLFLVKDGVLITPAVNGTFLNGITRQRVIALARRDGMEVQEGVVSYKQLHEADEIFASGNFGKLLVLTRLDERDYRIGPVYRRLRSQYWDFAHSRWNLSLEDAVNASA